MTKERQKPASSIVKPTCTPNTRNAAISVHAVLIGLTTSAAFSGASAAYTLAKKIVVTPAMIRRVRPSPTSLPTSTVAP